jgi:hypothetical protein
MSALTSHSTTSVEIHAEIFLLIFRERSRYNGNRGPGVPSRERAPDGDGLDVIRRGTCPQPPGPQFPSGGKRWKNESSAVS